jgi:hypothetical protein
VRQFEPVYPGLNHNSSSRRLLTNPESSKVIQEEVHERTTFRKADVGKMLFDRKISKLLAEATFYEEELLGVGQDELSAHLEELIILKDSSLNGHKELIEGLTALIQ